MTSDTTALHPPGRHRAGRVALSGRRRCRIRALDGRRVRRSAGKELVDNPEETDDLLRLGLHRLPIGEFPLLRGLATALASYDGAAELERGLDILLGGLAATLVPSATTPDGSGKGDRRPPGETRVAARSAPN
ncbi:hypothetical protein AB0D10_41900 [Kitasatospora sp. NPDC048545]|uniref:hypothetical protein n=1 Tax=Kitasatospora sp. NPDC048545 TaxID=3157208 RepID=UPI0033C6EFA5